MSGFAQAADAGAAVLVYSSDLDEVLALGDRVLVAAGGIVTEAPTGAGRHARGRNDAAAGGPRCGVTSVPSAPQPAPSWRGCSSSRSASNWPGTMRGAALAALGNGAFGSWDAFTSGTLVRSVPLILIGLGFALALRGGALNIGAEGQFYLGAIAATWVGVHAVGWPGWVALPLVARGGTHRRGRSGWWCR